MRVAIAQIDTRPADLEGTPSRIEALSRRAVQEGAQLLVLPFAAMTGTAGAPGEFAGPSFVLDLLWALTQVAKRVACPCLVPVSLDFGEGQGVTSALLLRDGAAVKVFDHGRRDKFCTAEHDKHEQHSGQQIDHAAGENDDALLPGRFGLKGPGVLTVPLLPFHGDIAADGQQTERVFGLFSAALEQPGPHANGEFIDFYAKEFGEGKMACLMGEDDKAEKQNGQQYGPEDVPDM